MTISGGGGMTAEDYRARFVERPMSQINHGYVAYTSGCRCETCRRAKSDYMRDRRAAARTAANAHPDIPGRNYVPGIVHGRYGYEERGCRCPDCLEAKRDEYRRLRTKNPQRRANA